MTKYQMTKYLDRNKCLKTKLYGKHRLNQQIPMLSLYLHTPFISYTGQRWT